MLKIFLTLLSILLFLSACGANEPATTPVPTQPALEGSVQITSPQLGSIIYAETLAITGIIEDVDTFQLQIETLDGETLFDGEIATTGGTWSREIIHGYAGEPIEAIMRAKSTHNSISNPYVEIPILLSSLTYREEGILGQILSPTESQSVGGDSIEIMGTSSGILDNRLTIMLRHDEGLLDKQIIVLDNPYLIDERVWTVSLLTNGYVGNATVEIAYTDSETESEQPLDTISIIIGSVAG